MLLKLFHVSHFLPILPFNSVLAVRVDTYSIAYPSFSVYQKVSRWRVGAFGHRLGEWRWTRTAVWYLVQCDPRGNTVGNLAEQTCVKRDSKEPNDSWNQKDWIGSLRCSPLLHQETILYESGNGEIHHHRLILFALSSSCSRSFCASTCNSCSRRNTRCWHLLGCKNKSGISLTDSGGNAYAAISSDRS